MFRNPFEAHSGFLPDPGGDPHLAGFALARLPKVRHPPFGARQAISK